MQPTIREKTHAINLVKQLMNKGLCKALSYYKQKEDDGRISYYLGLENWLNKNKEFLWNNNIVCNWGETKLCLLWRPLSNWVIKLGFLRSTNSLMEQCRIIDFCDLEADYYMKACDNGVGEFFAATYKIGTINKIGIYLQEFAQPNEDYFLSCFEKYISYGVNKEDFKQENETEEEIEDLYREYISNIVIDMDNYERVAAVFGEENVDNLIDFIEAFDINDLHEGNYGVTKDGRYVIFDFSGFC